MEGEIVVGKEDTSIRKKLSRDLANFEKKYALPGIDDAASREVFIEQLIESIRRVRYIAVMKRRDISPLRADPGSELFDPVKAAEYYRRNGRIEDAFWMVYIFVLFGRNAETKWRLARDVVNRLGQPGLWDWESTSRNPAAFRTWLAANELALKGGDAVLRKFGNHRKYESLNADRPTGIGNAVESYVDWVMQHGSHTALFENAAELNAHHPESIFGFVYASMSKVARFGRTARFDYLTMVGKLGLAPVEPGIPYIKNSTGPLAGAKLLFGGSKDERINPDDLETLVVRLGTGLGVGMQVMEDSLCNWQKNPDEFTKFRD
jgi:hypothetical protein